MHDIAAPRTASKQMQGLLKLMRPKQWVKNIFVLAPLFFSGELSKPASVRGALTATALFCIASSATYILNDLNDIERDRLHPTKSKSRPLASGAVTPVAAMVLMFVLAAILAGSAFVFPNILKVIACYIIINIAYTLFLKNQPVLDIFTIAFGFVLRVYAGASALAVPVSSWMFITTLCLALYLGAIKRRQELGLVGSQSRKVLEQYTIGLVDRYSAMAATGALFFYSMFVMSSKPHLVLTVLLVLFGLFRYWYVVERFDSGESPTDALLADWQLLATLALWLLICGWKLWPAA